MGSEVTTTVGHAPIPFGRFSGYGRAPSRGRGFAGSSDLVSLCQQALGRLRNAIDVANEACSSKESLDFWTGAATLNWLLGNNTSTASVCNAAAQMQLAYDDYSMRVADPNNTDDLLAQILVNIHQSTDISDLLETAKATGGGAALDLALEAPGEVVGLLGAGLGKVGAGIIGNVPWWAWAAGALYLATQLGWNPLKRGK